MAFRPDGLTIQSPGTFAAVREVSEPAFAARWTCGIPAASITKLNVFSRRCARPKRQDNASRRAATGNTVAAVLFTFADSVVYLRRSEGETAEVPLEELSMEDQAYIEEHGTQPRAATGGGCWNTCTVDQQMGSGVQKFIFCGGNRREWDTHRPQKMNF